jgi:predicted dehydrogenase
MRSGEDIYCEKPISHSLIEAKAMLSAARCFNRIVQIGTSHRSMKHFQDAIQFVRSCKMGKMNVCRALCCGISVARYCKTPPGLDWDFWLGPTSAVVPAQSLSRELALVL